MSNTDSIILWIDEDSFEVDISLPLGKASVDNIVVCEVYF